MSGEALCRIDEIPDGEARGFVAAVGERKIALVAVRQGDQVYVYENVCPHNGSPLDMFPDTFLDEDGENIECATHGALFRIDDGVCIAGPCEGDALTPIGSQIEDGVIYVRAGA